MIGAGCVSRVMAAWVGNVSAGVGYCFRRAVEHAVPRKIEVVDYSNFTVALALHAAALGVPFLPTYATLGSDLLKKNGNLREFSSPVSEEKLVAVRALETSEATLQACVEVGRRMGKEVVVIRESPGFVTSRINAMIGNEAFYMLQEGVASAEDIDKALKLGLNHPMGPFELVDLVGLDVRLNILEYLHKTLGEKYRPCPLLAQYVKAGRTGRKSGRGVYEYAKDAAKK